MKYILAVLNVVLCFSLHAQAPVQNFKLTNVIDGAVVSLETYPTCSGLVIIFTSNVCPYDGYYTERIKGFIATYREKIEFLFVNSFQESEESVDQMKSMHSKWGISVPYLADKDQAVMACLGAKKSPEVFLLKNLKGSYTIVYSGAIDDNPQMASAVTQPYLKLAIEKMLAGQSPDPVAVRAAGCSIRRK